MDDAGTVAYCEALFRDELQGARLIANRSIWRRFPTIVNERWHDGNMVLLGDAAHTAHYSVGSGTKLAMEDAIALTAAISAGGSIDEALTRYGKERRGPVESLQRSAQASLEWFENTERYMDTAPIQFGFNLVTRSLRITHEDLRQRDPGYIAQLDAWFAEGAELQAGAIAPAFEFVEPQPSGATRRVAPPFLTPFKLRDLVLDNRIVVSAMCQYSAEDGMPDDWHHGAPRQPSGGRGRTRDGGDDRRDAGRSHHPGMHGTVGRQADARVEEDRRLRPQAHAREDRHPARPRRAQGRLRPRVGRRRAAPRRRAVGADGPVPDAVVEVLAGAAGNDGRGHGRK
jgi:hypothetical protein